MDGLVMKYFVLKPAGRTPYHDASRMAMLAYAEAIQNENPDLAKDLRVWAGAEALAATRQQEG